MEGISENQNHQDFPEDKDAPHVEAKGFLNKFYIRNRTLVDVFIFIIMLVSTLTTVSLTVYIIASKYF